VIHERGAKRAYGIIGHDIESDVIFWNTLYRSGSTCCQRRPKSQEVHAIREWSQIRNHLRFVGLQRPRGSLISTISSPPFTPPFLKPRTILRMPFTHPTLHFIRTTLISYFLRTAQESLSSPTPRLEDPARCGEILVKR